MESETQRRLWVARHGERIDFVDPDWSATAARPHDPELSAEGMRQAELLALALREAAPAHIFCSPCLRALQTARPVARLFGLEIKVEDAFCEWLNPAWFSSAPQWLDEDTRRRMFPEVSAEYRSLGKAEYPEEEEQAALDRIGAAMRRILQAFSGDIIVIGHGVTVLGIVKELTGIRPDSACGLACLSELHLGGAGGWRLVRDCDVSHLDLADTGRWR